MARTSLRLSALVGVSTPLKSSTTRRPQILYVKSAMYRQTDSPLMEIRNGICVASSVMTPASSRPRRKQKRFASPAEWKRTESMPHKLHLPGMVIPHAKQHRVGTARNLFLPIGTML